jgi:type IV pilus assembly protein PilC
MAFCTYKVKNLQGDALKGKCWCKSREDLAKTFREKGYYLVFYKEDNLNKQTFFIKKISLKELAEFCSQFSSLLSAGIGLFEIIRIISEETSKSHLKIILKDIENMLHQGVNLSSAMKGCHDFFPLFFINMVKAGEEGGRLEEVFNSLSKYYSDEDVIRNRIIKALIYPTTVFIVSVIVLQILVIFIVPVFVSTIGELGAELPQSTKLMLQTSSFIRGNALILFILSVSGIYGVLRYIRIDSVKVKFHKFLATNYFVKRISQKVIAVKFSYTLSILLCSGIQIIRALEITCAVFDNSYVKGEIEKCISYISKGATISKSINSLKLFPAMLCSMIRIGEESGCLDTMLLKASKILERELTNTIDKLTTLIEPAIIIFLSFFIGGILITLLTPMFNVMNAI